jgi:3-oxoacyl-[acyl-carrier-protein] synthase II
VTRRVVVTGMGGVTSLGEAWSVIKDRFARGETGIVRMAEWERYHGLNTRLAAPLVNFSVDERYDRKKLRTMGPVSRMAAYATERALDDAGLRKDKTITGGRTGIAYGSSFGSAQPVLAFAEMVSEGASTKLNATSYVQMMSHTAAVNIGLLFGVKGRIVTTSSACTSGSQAIGYSYEAIRYGIQDIMIAGGAEELCAPQAGVFDTLYATSTRNDAPTTTPRPYDRDRDGLVIGEGAATLILESLEHAQARGAKIYAEIVGFGTNSDGNHITQPAVETMEVALRLALADAKLGPEAIGFVSGHGTATDWGDVAETQATANALGNKAPIHSLKSYFGHTLGACGSMEAWLMIEMMRDKWFAHTANLDNIEGSGRALDIEYGMSNNFAFGGINTSLIFRRFPA